MYIIFAILENGPLLGLILGFRLYVSISCLILCLKSDYWLAYFVEHQFTSMSKLSNTRKYCLYREVIGNVGVQELELNTYQQIH